VQQQLKWATSLRNALSSIQPFHQRKNVKSEAFGEAFQAKVVSLF
jgi:hypothetical protein